MNTRTQTLTVLLLVPPGRFLFYQPFLHHLLKCLQEAHGFEVRLRVRVDPEAINRCRYQLLGHWNQPAAVRATVIQVFSDFGALQETHHDHS